MGKSRAQIQKEYRDRKKAKLGEEYMQKERERVRKYYIPAKELSNKKRKERNEKMKIKNRRSRARARERLERLRVRESIDDGPSDSGYGSGYPSTSRQSEPMIVRLPAINVLSRAKGGKRKQARALARAHKSINVLERKKNELERKLKTKSKQLERLRKKFETRSKSLDTPSQIENQATTPRSKTSHEVEQLNLTPRRKKTVAKKLLLTNVLLAEVKKTKETSSRKKRSILHNIVAGRISRKYKCMKAISAETGLSHRALLKCKSKCLKYKIEQRKSLSKEHAKKVIEFLSERGQLQNTAR
ncbi:luc7-like protein 3 [Mercenaria mercenaria]|uniref:luc7-like protein 3 n=1 Tax=Mercenaria mercenaria TaxID=6596 RepID=UPI00234E6EAD|nr:luc7-like protein 3 [Mercenaria mercenaria]